VPRNTSPEVVEKLNKDVSSVHADANFQARVAELGGTVIPGTSANFGKLVDLRAVEVATISQKSSRDLWLFNVPPYIFFLRTR
jgi:tripartite-type tricarboxylate transporter receptor subunit TctC